MPLFQGTSCTSTKQFTSCFTNGPSHVTKVPAAGWIALGMFGAFVLAVVLIILSVIYVKRWQRSVGGSDSSPMSGAE